MTLVAEGGQVQARSEGDDPSLPAGLNRRRHRRWATAGAAAGAVLFFTIVTAGTFNPLRADPWPAAGFSDAQVEAWFDGKWDVPSAEASAEAFVIEERHYIYFGPFPALIRVPFLAVSDWFDQRLSALSLCAAYIVALAGATGLSWRIRTRCRGPDAPFTRRDAAATFTFMLVLGGGSNVLYLASKTWAYQEAVLWAIAWALWSFALLSDYLREPAVKTMALASLFATFAFSSRGAGGLAPVAALAVVAGVALLQAVAAQMRGGCRLLEWPGRWIGTRRLPLVAPLLGVLAPTAAYAAVNYVKFGSLFRLPIDSQVYVNEVSPSRIAALEANGGSLFGLKFIPTNLVHYLRPDAFDIGRLFPFFGPEADPPLNIGNVVFDGIEPAASISVTMPILLVLGAIGIWVILRGRDRPEIGGVAPLRVLVLGGGAGTLAGLSIAWNTQRYQGDFMPLLVVGALAGMHHLLARGAARDEVGAVRHRTLEWVGAAAVVVLVATSIWTNAALAITYQQVRFPTEQLPEFVALQQGIDGTLFPGRTPIGVTQGAELPLVGTAPGDLFIIGECDGLYAAGASLTANAPWEIWLALERTEATGGYRLTLSFPDDPAGRYEPLLVTGPEGDRMVLAVEYLGDDQARFALGVENTGEWATDLAVPIDTTEDQTFDIVFDPRGLNVTVENEGEMVFSSLFSRPYPNADIAAGEDGFAPMTSPTFTGEIEHHPMKTPTCDGILERMPDR